MDRLGLEFGPYPPEAYQFVREGLEHTSSAVHGDATAATTAPPGSRHVDGRQLCIGLRDYAIDQFGLMALTVLRRWHIRRTEDFGRIVFNMVEAGLLSKTDDDRLTDFEGVYDFDEAFGLVEVG
ncbi:MAG: hypothetical protein IBJ10_09290 [Phycisphaerales bacterium]|nr:hypothetical protein [Phycisphaerales bacterium]